jgi:hypothetical protein
MTSAKARFRDAPRRPSTKSNQRFNALYTYTTARFLPPSLLLFSSLFSSPPGSSRPPRGCGLLAIRLPRHHPIPNRVDDEERAAQPRRPRQASAVQRLDPLRVVHRHQRGARVGIRPARHVALHARLRVVPYKAKSGWSSKASDGVQRRRGRGLKPRGARRDATGKVLKDRRSPRERGRMGTGVRRTHLRRVHRVRQHRGDGAADAAPDDGRRQLVVLREGSVERVDIKGEARRQLESRNVAARRDRNQGVVV